MWSAPFLLKCLVKDKVYFVIFVNYFQEMKILDELLRTGNLPDEGLATLIEGGDAALTEELHRFARREAEKRFGRQVYLRALIEWTNVCREDCLYCGIRRSNGSAVRYILTPSDVLEACGRAHADGIRTFVLQGGENPAAAEAMVPVVAEIRRRFPDSAITLGFGELPFELYAALREAGADRYLMRHETADPAHFGKLHPSGQTFAHRLDCLRELRRLGFQIGMGMMVGSPFQTTAQLIADLRLLQEWRPEMIGVGPFLPQKDTPLGGHPAGSAEMTLRLYSILRLMLPDANIPSTTALASIMPGGRVRGILAGANVIMPSYTPSGRGADYKLYDCKLQEGLQDILKELSAIGYGASPSRGDYKEFR